jgi:hypothetical protein
VRPTTKKKKPRRENFREPQKKKNRINHSKIAASYQIIRRAIRVIATRARSRHRLQNVLRTCDEKKKKKKKKNSKRLFKPPTKENTTT